MKNNSGNSKTFTTRMQKKRLQYLLSEKNETQKEILGHIDQDPAGTDYMSLVNSNYQYNQQRENLEKSAVASTPIMKFSNPNIAILENLMSNQNIPFLPSSGIGATIHRSSVEQGPNPTQAIKERKPSRTPRKPRTPRTPAARTPRKRKANAPVFLEDSFEVEEQINLEKQKEKEMFILLNENNSSTIFEEDGIPFSDQSTFSNSTSFDGCDEYSEDVSMIETSNDYLSSEFPEILPYPLELPLSWDEEDDNKENISTPSEKNQNQNQNQN